MRVGHTVRGARSNVLMATYNPVDLASVRRADDARLIGRRKRRDGT